MAFQCRVLLILSTDPARPGTALHKAVQTLNCAVPFLQAPSSHVLLIAHVACPHDKEIWGMQADKAQQKWEDIEGLKQQAERQQQDVAKAEAALAKARADLEGLPGLEESASQNAGDIDGLKLELRDLGAQVPLCQSSHKFKPSSA